MKHTECKDCELSNGDCGYHFKMDGVTNYDIASLSACDRYGNCEFFKPKANLQGDLISRDALKKTLSKEIWTNDMSMWLKLLNVIDNAPAIAVDEEIERQREELYQSSKKLFDTARMLGVARPQGEWVRKYDEEYDLVDFKCSNCGEEYPHDYNFCPNCGTSMMEGGAE